MADGTLEGCTHNVELVVLSPALTGAEGGIAAGASEPLLSSVGALVFEEVSRVCKGLRAERAFKRLLSRVGPLVPDDVRTLREGLRAEGALEWLLSRVATGVAPHVCSAKKLATVGALDLLLRRWQTTDCWFLLAQLPGIRPWHLQGTNSKVSVCETMRQCPEWKWPRNATK